jgi:hypothetical protein
MIGITVHPRTVPFALPKCQSMLESALNCVLMMRTTPIVTHNQASAPTYNTFFTSLQSCCFLQQILEEQHIFGLYVWLLKYSVMLAELAEPPFCCMKVQNWRIRT